MILIAPDKYKGTLTAPQAAEIIARATGRPCIQAPMADGGEGTASVLCRGEKWQFDGVGYINSATGEAVIDSSAVIGLQNVDIAHHNLLTASSAPLGEAVKRLLDQGCPMVTIGIGGTSTCDGGAGFLNALGDGQAYRHRLRGLSDVQVPLVAPFDRPSALMFAPQKGATHDMIPLLAEKLREVERQYGPARSPFDGAGGGLGYALASVIGCEVLPGSRYVLDSYHIDWSRISLVITGEGRYDRQTSLGKVIDEVRTRCKACAKPLIIIPGTVEHGCESPGIIPADRYLPDLPLNPDTAARRLELAVKALFSKIQTPDICYAPDS